MNRRLLALALLLVPGALLAQDASSDYTAPYQRQALEVYRTTIGYRTAATHGQVPALAEYLAREFREGGFPASDVHVLPITLPGGEEAASLVVRYRGNGSSGRQPILLMAHMDVVDALPEDWERDPFTLIEEDGYFFGRGTLDDKFGVAALTATFLRLKAEGFVPTRDLIIAFSGDEETGMLSTRALVTEHRALTDAEFALNADAGGGVLGEQGEGLYYEIQTSEKTYATFELTVRNPGGHSSTPREDNAIYELATALENVQAYRFPVMTNETTLEFFRRSAGVKPGPVGDAMRRFAEDPTDEEAVEVLWHQPEYVGITRTTCVATMLRAGHAENALPQSATATVNCRIFPGVEVDEVRRTLGEVAGNPDLEIVTLDEPLPSPASPMREDVRAAVAEAVESRYPGVSIIPAMAPYGTDGKEMRAAGIPTYGVMGLFMKPDEAFAHGLNERVPVREFFGALEHWHTILTNLAGR
ncbi:MAG: M20/M25/M40 family metallo-hydrolase [Gemmatimonadota bacterium]|nr:M20/M25/M40 family metallo-hydrolase [Gemmatimonadota bacterium]